MQPVTIVGAGGIGCAIGYALSSTGVPVTFVETDTAKLAWGRAHGVRVDNFPPQRAEFLAFDDWQPAPDSTALLCTKCYDNPPVLRRLPASVTLIPIQNGFDPELDALGHVWEGIASFVSECAPGRTHTRITRGGKLHFGKRGAWSAERETLGNGIAHRAPRSALRALRIRVALVPDILPYKYTKLMYNAAISPIAAAAALDNGQLLSVPKARRLFFELLRENYAILHGAGIPLGKVGPFHPDTVSLILRSNTVAHAFAWAFYPTLRCSYCSMSGDLPKGRTEIDYYNRHLIDVANGQPCPLNHRVYELVKRMERQGTAPGLEQLDELVEKRPHGNGLAASRKSY